MNGPALPTSLVGTYAQPEWLIHRKNLAGRFPPRVRAKELWHVAPEFFEAAQDDATLLAIRDQERVGLHIITDGEQRRESYSNRFATALEGVDIDNPGTALDRSGHPNPVPRIVGKIRRKRPVEVRDVEFLRANTDRTIKISVPGPHLLWLGCHHPRAAGVLFIPAELAASPVQQGLDRDRAIQARLLGAGKAAGQDHHPRHARPIGYEHRVARKRIRRALPPAERIVVAPDCGLKYLPRDVAFVKMRAMVEGAKIVRQKLSAKYAR